MGCGGSRTKNLNGLAVTQIQGGRFVYSLQFAAPLRLVHIFLRSLNTTSTQWGFYEVEFVLLSVISHFPLKVVVVFQFLFHVFFSLFVFECGDKSSLRKKKKCRTDMWKMCSLLRCWQWSLATMPRKTSLAKCWHGMENWHTNAVNTLSHICDNEKSSANTYL